jgi:hypothetical protein
VLLTAQPEQSKRIVQQCTQDRGILVGHDDYPCRRCDNGASLQLASSFDRIANDQAQAIINRFLAATGLMRDLRHACTHVVERHRLRDGPAGWRGC